MSGPSRFQQYFPFSPEYSTWEDWNGNVAIWYGQENIPQVSEAEWQSAAQQIMETPTFAVFPISSPNTFETWQEWAEDFSQIINGPSR